LSFLSPGKYFTADLVILAIDALKVTPGKKDVADTFLA